MKYINRGDINNNDSSEILVSIICNTYNQQDYIADALKSFIMQKAGFKFEVLVHDDASSDNTAAIIRKFEQKYPEIIKPIYQSDNQYSRNIPINDIYQIPRAKGKYIAFCEGDDYWTDCHKLQKQVTLMEKYTQCDICAHSAIMVDEKNKRILGVIAPCTSKTVIPTEKVILGGGGFVSTNSLMLRKQVFLNQPEFRKSFRYDYSLQIMGALRGGMLYIVDFMSAYRFQAKSSWTERMKENPEIMISMSNSMINMLLQLDKETDMKFHQAVLEMIQNQEQFITDLKENRYDLKKPISRRTKIKAQLKYRFPFLLRLKLWGK